MLGGDGSDRLKRYRKIGFLGKGFFATVDEYVRLDSCCGSICRGHGVRTSTVSLWQPLRWQEDVETGERVAIKKEEKKKDQLKVRAACCAAGQVLCGHF